MSVFTEIIEITQPDLLRYAFMITKNSELSYDLCQDTYITAYNKINTLKDPKQIKSWLFRILKNKFLDHKKSKKNDAYVEFSSVEETVFGNSDPDTVSNLNEINGLLAQVSEEDRELILLVYMEEMTFKEVADVTGMNENTVKTRVYRAIKEIKKD